VLDSLSLILLEAEDDFFDLLISLSGFAEHEIKANEIRSEVRILIIF